MIFAVANHLWQSTLFAGFAALLALVLRRNQARTRYGLWLIASVKFLIPFSALVAVGKHLELFAAPAKAQKLSLAVAQIGQPFAPEQIDIAFAPAIAVHNGSDWPVFLFALWVCGFLAVAFSSWRRWRRVRTSARMGSPLFLPINIPVRSSPVLLEPGVFGIFRPVLLLPEGIAERLTAKQLDAVIAHEMCHVRRRDNLTAALHIVVENLFWFHPLVWWLGARLVEERERACDEEVLQLGNEPQVYAESILKTCEFYLESPLACVSGITGADLKKRIVRIMTRGLEKKLDFWRKLLLGAAGVAALAGPIVLGLTNPPQSRAQSQPNASSFEVASIKLNHTGGGMNFSFSLPSWRFTGRNLPVKFLIQQAYHVKDSQISGAASWIDSEHYDIDAKMEDSTAEAMRKLSPEKGDEQIMLLFQSLLRDRFKLALHHDTKEMPVYVLLVGKNGPKLKETALTPAELMPPMPKGPSIRLKGRGHLTMTAVDINMLAEELSRQAGRVVLNKTELKARYDFELQWTPEEGEGPAFKGAGAPPGEAAPPPDVNGPTLFTAIQEQLGLKLESQKAPLDVLVIDHIERPTEN